MVQFTDPDAGETGSRQPAPASDGAVDPLAVSEAIRSHGDHITQQELQQAISRLKAHGTLPPEQRRIVAEMAHAISEAILSSPEAVLANTADHDAETVQTAVDLFHPNG